MTTGEVPTTTNFGEFFDAASATENFFGEMWMREIRRNTSEEDWSKFASDALNAEGVSLILEGVRWAMRNELGHISDNEFYSDIREQGREFIREIQQKAAERGIVFDEDEATKPVTLVESLMAMGEVDWEES